VGLKNKSKCHQTLESCCIIAPVAAHPFNPRREFAVSIVHLPINTARRSRRKGQELSMKCKTIFTADHLFSDPTDEKIPEKVWALNLDWTNKQKRQERHGYLKVSIRY
jgi:hypothetical protein